MPSESIKLDLNTSTKMLHMLYGKNCATNEILDEGYLVSLSKKWDLKECKNWKYIILLSTSGESLNRIILERLKT